MNVRVLRDHFFSNWQKYAWYGGLFLVIGFVLVWKLNTLVPGYSAQEVQSYQTSIESRHQLLANPLNAPFYLLVRLLTHLHPHSYIDVRIVSVIIAMAVLASFTWLLTSLKNRQAAIVGTLLFGLSAWFLHVARLGTPAVLYLGVFGLVACGWWLKRSGKRLALISCFVLGPLLLYLPGMLWFILAGVVSQWRTIGSAFRQKLLGLSYCIVIALVLVTPLGWALSKHHHLIRTWLGFPSNLPAPLTVLHNFVDVPIRLFIRNSPDPVTWLGSAPILDAFSIAMLVVGCYYYMQHMRSKRQAILIGTMLVLAAVLVAIGSPVTLSVMLPFLYLLIASGVSYFISMWLTVFPRNPIARGIGWSLLGILIALVLTYHLKHYFIGWPQAAITQTVFTAIKP